mmetsp:Transcript_17092/g.44512  ORF Transcript_17092/g.44512 Transcript_17092/m.44512 type:complete len:213 (+) Transcript_17092:1177-1815(+)
MLMIRVTVVVIIKGRHATRKTRFRNFVRVRVLIIVSVVTFKHKEAARLLRNLNVLFYLIEHFFIVWIFSKCTECLGLGVEVLFDLSVRWFLLVASLCQLVDDIEKVRRNLVQLFVVVFEDGWKISVFKCFITLSVTFRLSASIHFGEVLIKLLFQVRIPVDNGFEHDVGDRVPDEVHHFIHESVINIGGDGLLQEIGHRRNQRWYNLQVWSG